MTIWITPIIDRVQVDINSKTAKGYISHNDLNRIEGNSVYIAEQLNVNGYKVTIITKTDWTMGNFPYLAEIDRIRDNINALINAYYKMNGSPDIIYWDSLNWQDANSLEQNLLNIDILLGSMIQSFKYCGEFACGEDVI